jgi:hypothetical protein
MMEKEEFIELAKREADVAISIYLPTHNAGKEINEKKDLIRFKNLLQAVTADLNEKGLTNDQMDALLSPAFDLLKEEEFWLRLDKGLAVFISNDFFEIKKVHLEVPEEFHINSTFHLTPLVDFYFDRPYFYLLVISKHSSAVYKSDELAMERLEIEGLPQGMDDVIHFEEKSESKLFRMGGGSSGQKGSLHGHGSGLKDDKEYVSQYLKEVDQTLMTELLANENAPLLVAGVEYVAAIFKQVSHYKNVVDVVLTGNYEHTDMGELFQKSLALIQPYLQGDSKKALKNYYDQITSPLTSSMPDKVIPAAYYKQIYDLFVEEGLHIWGTFNEAENKLIINDKKQPGDECLVNKAILKTIANGGDVHILDRDKMPNGAQIAASLRF